MKWDQFLDTEQMDTSEREELTNELYRQMFIVAYSKVSNKMDALDVVQESWLKILQSIDSLKDPEKILQWAKVIVSNTANNLLRRKLALQMVPLSMDMPDIEGGFIDSRIDELVMREEIIESIAQLDQTTGRMLICKYYYGWKDKDIAASLDCPVGTVKAKIHRGKDRLRAILLKD
ncbi:RNA polymerase sigma factor [Ferviditalea candida]|uniref:RNA polymerase sigma factor n=1 Tax=Ferviditalea candida TaxID=3108399 RepID=A0ABU5ZIY5_9BACL|nr:RNA polymerase sigma factor [Paenibacillaceae bacterium T2]